MDIHQVENVISRNLKHWRILRELSTMVMSHHTTAVSKWISDVYICGASYSLMQ